MYKYYFLLSRLILAKRFSLKLLLNISVIASVLICSLLIPLTLSLTEGFKSNIKNKIVDFDGFGRVYSSDLTQIEEKYIIDNYSSSIVSFSEQEAIVRGGNVSEGVTYIELSKLNHLNSFLLNSLKGKDQGIYIGSQLNDKLFSNNSSLNKVVHLITDSNKIYKKEVIGTFKTGITLYDKHTILELNTDIDKQGFILNKDDYRNIIYNLNIHGISYKDRYYNFIKWLDSYSLPINLLLIFLVLICMLNNSFCFNMDVINRFDDIKFLKTLGLSKQHIYDLLMLKYSILNILGFIIGSACCYVLLILESNYNFIKIPENVYFSSTLPISLRVINFLYVPSFLLINIIYKRYKKDSLLYEI